MYFGYQHIIGARVSGTTQYELSRVEESPIPKAALFQLWKDVALQQCANAKEKHNLTPSQCREKVEERHTNCASSAAVSAPPSIAEKGLAKQLGKQYLACATPYYFCNGVEVRSEEAARRSCQ